MGQKHRYNYAFAPSGRSLFCLSIPRALPWADGFCAYSAKFVGIPLGASRRSAPTTITLANCAIRNQKRQRTIAFCSTITATQKGRSIVKMMLLPSQYVLLAILSCFVLLRNGRYQFHPPPPPPGRPPPPPPLPEVLTVCDCVNVVEVELPVTVASAM